MLNSDTLHPSNLLLGLIFVFFLAERLDRDASNMTRKLQIDNKDAANDLRTERKARQHVLPSYSLMAHRDSKTKPLTRSWCSGDGNDCPTRETNVVLLRYSSDTLQSAEQFRIAQVEVFLGHEVPLSPEA